MGVAACHHESCKVDEGAHDQMQVLHLISCPAKLGAQDHYSQVEVRQVVAFLLQDTRGKDFEAVVHVVAVVVLLYIASEEQ